MDFAGQAWVLLLALLLQIELFLGLFPWQVKVDALRLLLTHLLWEDGIFGVVERTAATRTTTTITSSDNVVVETLPPRASVRQVCYVDISLERTRVRWDASTIVATYLELLRLYSYLHFREVILFNYFLFYSNYK